jgi:hypothetical protein
MTGKTAKGAKSVPKNSQKLLSHPKIVTYDHVVWGKGRCAIAFRRTLLRFSEDASLITIPG